ncbi:MAG: HNH endonuclease [Proteobacteria bacterium]|nr:HNH endonuclease [Pseudomonadota bacterium]MBU1740383.1 HNH endonuclease [Pseudomonadota bacterium]
MRSRVEGLRLCPALGQHQIGRTRTFSEEHKKNISLGRKRWAEDHARGVRKTPSGYLEFTRGEHKGRAVHVVMMEQLIGRRIRPQEIVHHVDGDRGNNKIDNLWLMTRSEHSRLHAKDNLQRRKRDHYGRFC